MDKRKTTAAQTIPNQAFHPLSYDLGCPASDANYPSTQPQSLCRGRSLIFESQISRHRDTIPSDSKAALKRSLKQQQQPMPFESPLFSPTHQDQKKSVALIRRRGPEPLVFEFPLAVGVTEAFPVFDVELATIAATFSNPF